MSSYYDDKETRSIEERETALFSRLPEFLKFAMAKAPGWRRFLSDINPEEINSREKLNTLPVLRKPELMEFQKQYPPFGEMVTGSASEFARVFMSPGPVWEPQSRDPNGFLAARALFAAGFRPGDIVHNAFSYHMTPGGFILDTGLRDLGCAVFPAGVGNTDQQVEAMAALKPVGYAGTPDYLKLLLDRAKEMKLDLSSVKRGLVSGGAFFPSLRKEYLDAGVQVVECYATADIGVIAYESEAMAGLIINEDLIVEIVRPGSNETVSFGEVGEIVVTSFNGLYPLIRFGTGDLSVFVKGESPCGRTNTRLAGWLGRADQRTKIKGMFVDPVQIETLTKKIDAVLKARLVVDRLNEQDRLILRIETNTPDEHLTARVSGAFRDIVKVGAQVECVLPGSLPNDGLVIADERVYN